MALSANEVTVHLSINEGIEELIQRLGALSPDAVTEMVLRNCVIDDAVELCQHIGRCVGLRCLSCVGCPLQPSRLIRLMLQQFKHLEHLEFSLFEDCEDSIKSEMRNMDLIASQMQGVDVTHTPRRVYVEVGGDCNFELLWKLLNCCVNLTELHAHLVRGTFWNALCECRLLHDKLKQLEMFTFTSELPVSFPLKYKPDRSSKFEKCATICANVRRKKSDDSWTCVDLGHLVLSSDRVRTLPTQVVVFAVSNFTVDAFREANRRHDWAAVRELCVQLPPPRTFVKSYSKAGPVYSERLLQLSSELHCIVELNLSSFHLRRDVSLQCLLQDSPLCHRLLALSAPPCWFRRQSSVHMLSSSFPNLTDLDVRDVSREGRSRCTICHNLPIDTERVQESCDATTLLSTGITRLTLCDVPYRAVLWFFHYYGAAVTLRLAEWRFVGSPQHGHLYGHLGEFGAIRCLVLQHRDLPINDQHLQASLSRLTSLQHLCLLTSKQVSYVDASKFLRAFFARSAQLKCLHIHYRHIIDNSEQRVTCVRRRQDEEWLRQGPCIACCSTATFIGLVKPVNRECVAGL